MAALDLPLPHWANLHAEWNLPNCQSNMRGLAVGRAGEWDSAIHKLDSGTSKLFFLIEILVFKNAFATRIYLVACKYALTELSLSSWTLKHVFPPHVGLICSSLVLHL